MSDVDSLSECGQDDSALAWLDTMSNFAAPQTDDSEPQGRVEASAVVFVSAERAQLYTEEPQAEGESAPIRNADRYRLWSKCITDVTDAIKDLRGEQLQPLTMVSHCAGVITEAQAYENMDIRF